MLQKLSFAYKAIVAILISLPFHLFSANYNITFTASGASTTIDYVKVQNLTQGTSVTVSAGSSLEVTAIKDIPTIDESIRIYPNPIKNKATLSYFASTGGSTQINVFGIDGRNLIGLSKNLSVGLNQFDLTLPHGAYTLQINEKGKLHTTKILSQSNNIAEIKFIGNENVQQNVPHKVKAISVPMQYNIGDIMIFKAYSGNYVSTLTDIISGDKTINFNFVECKDVDGNYYSTITIGNQVWMAENLKTSKYRNNIAITDKTNLSTWGTSTTEALSDYATPTNSTTYGKLYNWYAVSSPNNLAPAGWHIPSDADWTNLSDFFGGLNKAGDKLKENGNSHWLTANTTATNETGFTALPGGSRSTDNTIYDIGSVGYWWSVTEGTTTNNAWYRSLSHQNGAVTRGYFSKSGGMSVRCLMGDLPILSTTNASSISATGFASGGGISFDGNYPVTYCGVCWSTNQNPTINDLKTSDFNGTGTFNSTITGLSPQTTYYVRAYATNSYGTGYGSQITVSTSTPTSATTSISSITSTAAIGGGTVSIASGAAPIIARGICWSTNQNPTIADSNTSNGTGVGSFSSSLTGLAPETVYYVRAYATNSVGTAYGTQVSFSTKLPVLTTTTVLSITASTATCGGNITDIGGAAITNKGVCWSTSSNPTIALSTKTSNGTGSGLYTSSITGLTVGTTYYVRAYATNSIGTTYGNEISFTTVLPTVSTNNISSITSSTANCGGEVTSIGGATVTARGICWSTTSNPTISNSKTNNGTGLGVFSSSITGLTTETTYYVRAYATSSIGTVYGSEVSFSTKLATLSTTTTSALTANSVTTGGNITSIGGSAVISRGVCWSTSSNPTIINSKTLDGSGTGSFTSQITELAPETTYYIRAYATNSIGTAYGSQIIISTALPAVTTSSISTITSTSAVGGGNITLANNAGVVITSGVCWSTSQNPTIADSKTDDGSGIGTFTSSINGLTAETTYYVRAYATNSVGTAYGTQVSFSTKLPVISTTAVNTITATTANCGGNVTDIGGAAVTARGVCWSTTTNPTINSNKTTNSSGLGTFTSSITGLTIGTTYYVRAYATNSIGTVYGNEIMFSTNLPTITTTDISSITATSATSGGSVTDIGGSAVSARGICWSTTTNPTISNSKTSDGAGLGTFTSAITGLTIGTTYYARTYATNSIGTTYGSQVSFSTILPTVTSTAVSSITATSAVCGGNVTAIGGAPVTSRGVCWSTSSTPTIALSTKTSDGTGNGNFTSSITGLTIGTTYYVRSFATNSIGTVYGSQISFSTTLPTLTTSNVSSITANTATSGGNITNIGGSDIIERGICWSTSSNPTITENKTIDGIGSGIFSSSITGLTIGKTYFVRAYATNSIGTSYGNETTFSTNLPTVITTIVSSVTANTAVSGGTITDKGGSEITEKGICWGTSTNPTISNNKTTNGIGNGAFSSSIVSLDGVGSTYYIRSYATNSIGTTYGNEISFTVAALGTIYEDGYVFYLDGIGHGMICSLTDQSSGIRWAASTTSITYANGIEIGTGKSNTQKIVRFSYVNGTGAGDLCNNLSPKGTWFLPSRKELKLMYTILKANNIGGFTDSIYWTSTESESLSSGQYAEWVSFKNGYSVNSSKTELFSVRAVRNF